MVFAAQLAAPTNSRPRTAFAFQMAMSKIRSYQVGDEPVPGYRLTAFLGSGGFGEVWKATAPGGTEVALKINNLGMKGALKEFNSLKLVKRIQYPNLVPILAIWLKNEQGEILQESAFDEIGGEAIRGLSGTLTTATVEFVPRPEPAELVIAMGLGHKSLADRLEECRTQGLTGIPVEELLKYMHDAARAIDYLNSPRHEFGSGPKAIQHCDIKPPNILIVGDAAQVCDFGLAREVDNLRSTSLALSPVYAAPEMIESNFPSPSTDQYSLAMSYLELRTGVLPFPPNSTAHTVIQAHLTGKIDVSRLTSRERDVVKRATARRPSDRYASTVEFVAALREAVHPSGRAPRRAWLRWVAAAALLALIPSALALQWKLSSPKPLVLPEGFVAAPDAQMVDVHGHNCPDQIICERHGLHVPFQLINGRKAGTFYMMENKVSNDVFARFAEANPAAVATSRWRLGACARKQDLGVEGRDFFPVFRVTCVEAALCARWLGGQLPSVEQWDEAAGRFALATPSDPTPAGGPFREPLDPNRPPNEQVAVDRGAEGPLAAGSATHDVSASLRLSRHGRQRQRVDQQSARRYRSLLPRQTRRIDEHHSARPQFHESRTFAIPGSGRSLARRGQARDRVGLRYQFPRGAEIRGFAMIDSGRKSAVVILALAALTYASRWSFGQEAAPSPAADAMPIMRLEAGGPTSFVSGVAFNPQGSTLYAGGWDKVVRAWNWNAQSNQFVLDPGGTYRVPIGPALEGVINAVAVSPDGMWLATAGRGMVRGASDLRHPGWKVPAAGTMSASMRQDQGTIYLFNTRTRAVRLLRGHTAPVVALAFAPAMSGKASILISAGQEWDDKAQRFAGAVRAWDCASWELSWGRDAAECRHATQHRGLARRRSAEPTARGHRLGRRRPVVADLERGNKSSEHKRGWTVQQHGGLVGRRKPNRHRQHRPPETVECRWGRGHGHC